MFKLSWLSFCCISYTRARKSLDRYCINWQTCVGCRRHRSLHTILFMVEKERSTTAVPTGSNINFHTAAVTAGNMTRCSVERANWTSWDCRLMSRGCLRKMRHSSLRSLTEMLRILPMICSCFGFSGFCIIMVCKSANWLILSFPCLWQCSRDILLHTVTCCSREISLSSSILAPASMILWMSSSVFLSISSMLYSWCNDANVISTISMLEAIFTVLACSVWFSFGSGLSSACKGFRYSRVLDLRTKQKKYAGIRRQIPCFHTNVMAA